MKKKTQRIAVPLKEKEQARKLDTTTTYTSSETD